MDALLRRMLLFRPEGGEGGAGGGGGGEGGSGEGGEGGQGSGTPEGSEGGRGSGDAVPRSRLTAEAKARREAERRAEEAEKKLREAEQKDLSDKERAEREAAEAKARADAAEQRATKLERQGWIRDAASAAGFVDAADAIAHIDVLEVDDDGKTPRIGDEDAAKKAVDELAESRPHLVGKAGQRQQIGRPGGGGGEGNSGGSIPTDAEGKPDVKRGLGQDLLAHLGGGSGR